jgi:hypothetical protein
MWALTFILKMALEGELSQALDQTLSDRTELQLILHALMSLPTRSARKLLTLYDNYCYLPPSSPQRSSPSSTSWS